MRLHDPWVFLPDNCKDPAPAEGCGLVRADTPAADWVASLAKSMLTTGESPAWAAPDVLNIDARCERALAQQDSGEALWRGMLSMMLLWDAWEHSPDEPRLVWSSIDENSGAFSASTLNAMSGRKKALTLVSLELPGKAKIPLGLISGHVLFAPAANLAALTGHLPPRVTWYDDAQGSFCDPCDFLSDQDRLILQEMLMRLLLIAREKKSVTLIDALTRFLHALDASRQSRAAQAQALSSQDASMLETNLLIAAGLQPEASFPMLSQQRLRYVQTRSRLLAAHGVDCEIAAASPVSTWFWRGVPFMQQDAALGLKRIPGDRAKAAMTDIAQEIDRLLCHAPAWCRRAVRRIEAWCAEPANPCAVKALTNVSAPLLARLNQFAAMPGEEIQLVWPWTADSGSVRLLAESALGEDCADVVTAPFSDKLTLVAKESVSALGLQTLQLYGDGTVNGEMDAFASLPTISAAFAEALIRHRGGKIALVPDGMRFLCHADATGASCITASITLAGTKRVVLTRTYSEDDIVSLLSDETPTVAVWPSIPMAVTGWHSYYVYASNAGAISVEALTPDGWRSGQIAQAADSPAAQWFVQHMPNFPACLLLKDGDVCLGALPNLLPELNPPVRPNAVLSLDFGTSGTAVAIAQSNDVKPLFCSSARRVLLYGDRPDAPDAEFIDGGAVQPVFSGALEVFVDSSTAPHLPLVDARITAQSPFIDNETTNARHVYWGLKWTYGRDGDEAKHRYLLNLMQTAVHTAAMMGSRSVSWRIAMPADMAAEGKRTLYQVVQLAASVTADLTGIPLTEGIPPVSWAEESVAIGHYFRKMSSQPVRGGFMSLDIGGGSSKLMLWLRGMPQPALMLSLPHGAQHMLLEALMANPNFLQEDFTPFHDDALNTHLMQVSAQFARARTDMRALKTAQYLLDELLARDLPKMHQYMNSAYSQGVCIRTQALLLMQISFLLMLAGVMQEQVFCDTTLNDFLPPYMEICLAGRGTQMMYGFNTALQRRLSGFVRVALSAEHPTREHAFIPSDAMKLEAAMGLSGLLETHTGEPVGYVPSDRPGAHWIDPVALLKRYLTAFRRELPLAAMRLFPEAYDASGSLTQAAVARLQTIAANNFAGQGRSIEQNCTAWLATLLQWMA